MAIIMLIIWIIVPIAFATVCSKAVLFQSRLTGTDDHKAVRFPKVERSFEPPRCERFFNVDFQVSFRPVRLLAIDIIAANE